MWSFDHTITKATDLRLILSLSHTQREREGGGGGGGLPSSYTSQVLISSQGAKYTESLPALLTPYHSDIFLGEFPGLGVIMTSLRYIGSDTGSWYNNIESQGKLCCSWYNNIESQGKLCCSWYNNIESQGRLCSWYNNIVVGSDL